MVSKDEESTGRRGDAGVGDQSDQRFRILVSNVRDYAIFLLDPDGTILTWNAGAENLKGYKPDEVIGQKITKFYTQPDIDREHPQYELKIALESGRYEEEGWRIRKDGSVFWANIVITRLLDENGQHIGFAKITRDLTERRKAEQALRESEERLKTAHDGLEKRVIERTRDLKKAVESRDEFISIASHELRTPLTVLKLQHQLLERQIAKAEEETVPIAKLKEVSGMTLRQVNQLLRLVEDMLDVSRIATGRLNLRKESGNLNELVSYVFETFAVQFETAGIKATLKIDGTIKFDFDPHRIEQVVSNLISNAIKYGESSPITLAVRKQDSQALIEVVDGGKGMEESDQQRVFERFERAVSANEVSGLGLGLFISKQIAIAHGGDIDVESGPTKGTKFTVRLPLQV